LEIAVTTSAAQGASYGIENCECSRIDASKRSILLANYFEDLPALFSEMGHFFKRRRYGPIGIRKLKAGEQKLRTQSLELRISEKSRL